MLNQSYNRVRELVTIKTNRGKKREKWNAVKYINEKEEDFIQFSSSFIYFSSVFQCSRLIFDCEIYDTTIEATAQLSAIARISYGKRYFFTLLLSGINLIHYLLN